jgi:hypothetical protein
VSEQIREIYDDARWCIFNQLRLETAYMMTPISDLHIEAKAYGSIARGDVSDGSDIDIFIPHLPSPALIEASMDRYGIHVTMREIVQATPSYAAKGYIYVGEKRSYSFPLVDLRAVESEFYGFAGSVNSTQIEENLRVPGVDKRLMLIEPTPEGHNESPVYGIEGIVAKKLRIDIAVVLERVKTLRRRKRFGRTGVYIKHSLAPEESFGEVFKSISRYRPALRRRLRK